MEVVNNLEFRVVSLRRSGHHAFIYWLGKNCRGKGCLLNLPSLNCNIFNNTYNAELYPDNGLFDLDLAREREGQFSKKDYLIYNLENENLEIFQNDDLENTHDAYAGKSEIRFDVLMLRDPFNTFASSLKFYHRIPSIFFRDYIAGLPVLWKQYAREYLGKTCFLPNSKVVVNYNAWCSSREERALIIDKLGLGLNYDAVDFIPQFGGGSSFKKNEQKSGWGVMERWKYFQKSNLFRSLFDVETIALSEEIFGHLPGTDVIYPSNITAAEIKSVHQKARLEQLPYYASYYKGRLAKHIRKLARWLL